MNAYRRNFTPVPLHEPRRRRLLWLATWAFFVALVTYTLVRHLFAPASPPITAPAPHSQARGLPLPSLGVADGASLAEIRAEAFRAGLQEGQQQQGCVPPSPSLISARP